MPLHMLTPVLLLWQVLTGRSYSMRFMISFPHPAHAAPVFIWTSSNVSAQSSEATSSHSTFPHESLLLPVVTAEWVWRASRDAKLLLTKTCVVNMGKCFKVYQLLLERTPILGRMLLWGHLITSFSLSFSHSHCPIPFCLIFQCRWLWPLELMKVTSYRPCQQVFVQGNLSPYIRTQLSPAAASCCEDHFCQRPHLNFLRICLCAISVLHTQQSWAWKRGTGFWSRISWIHQKAVAFKLII